MRKRERERENTEKLKSKVVNFCTKNALPSASSFCQIIKFIEHKSEIYQFSAQKICPLVNVVVIQTVNKALKMQFFISFNLLLNAQ